MPLDADSEFETNNQVQLPDGLPYYALSQVFRVGERPEQPLRTGPQEDCGPIVPFCATLTAERFSLGSGSSITHFAGYSSWLTKGEVSSRSFRYKGVTYTVDGLSLQILPQFDSIRVNISPALPYDSGTTGLVLDVGGRWQFELILGQSVTYNVDNHAEGTTFFLNQTSVDLPPDGTQIPVSIRRAVASIGHGSPLRPEEVGLGKKFRLLFVARTFPHIKDLDTIDGSSGDIADYDRFVRKWAVTGSHAANRIGRKAGHFQALACTDMVDARDHTGTTYSDSDKGVPIYWLNGSKVADDYEDFYDGSWDEEEDGRDPWGDDYSFDGTREVATGCLADGTYALSGTTLGNDSGRVRAGLPGSDDDADSPLSSAKLLPQSGPKALYALSGVFEVRAHPPTIAQPEVTVGDTRLSVTLSVKPNGTELTGLRLEGERLPYRVGERNIETLKTFDLTASGFDPGSAGHDWTGLRKGWWYRVRGVVTWEGGSATSPWTFAVTGEDQPRSALLENADGEDPIAAPGPPRGLTSTVEGTTATLSWQPPDSGGGVLVYRILRFGDGQEWVELKSATAETTYTDTGLAPGGFYVYRVSALNVVGEGPWFGLGLQVPAAVPGPPRDLTATVGGSRVVLSWQPPESDGGARVSGYRVEGSADGTSWAELEAATTETAYTDDGVAPGGVYRYRVAALNSAGVGAYSAEASVVVQANRAATGVPAMSGTARMGETLTADVSGIDDQDGLTNATYAYQWLADGAAISGATGSTYTLADADAGKTIKLRVSFTDDAGNEETLTSAATATVAATVPAQPTVLTVAKGSQIQELNISWQAPTSDGGSAVTGYKVQWKEAEDSWDTQADVSVATVNETFHTITGLTGGVEYAVRVIAANAVGDGLPSAQATGTPAGGVSEQNTEAENNAPTGLPTISGTVQVGETLTADVSAIDDEDGLSNATYAYQWLADGADIGGATGSTYTLADADQGKAIKLRVSFTDDGGNDETLTSAPTSEIAARPNIPATGEPVISGDALVGETLTVDVSGIDDEDGTENAVYAYRWLAGDAAISGATGSSYTLANADVGKTIKVKVSFTDDAENAESLTSAQSEAVAATVPTAPQELTVSPATQSGQLDVSWQAPRSNGGSAITGYTVQWKEAADSWDTSTDVSEATVTDTNYAIISLTAGTAYTVQVTASNSQGNGAASVEATASAPEEQNSAPVGLPAISGTPEVEQTLTAGTTAIDDADGLTNVSYEYQWIADGTDIDGATSSTHTLTASEQGQTIQVRVTFTDDRNNAETLTSAATVAVAAAPVPLTVRLKVAAPTTHDGSFEFTFEIEFSEEFGLSYVTLRDFAFTETGGEVRKAQRMDKPSNIRWLITVEPNGNGDVTIELPATTDCNAEGAICTADGRKLSNRLEVTVSGPGQ